VDDGLIIVDGGTFLYGDRAGDVEAQRPEGFYYEDVRHLSHWCLTVDGKPIVPLTSRVVDHFSARIHGARDGEEQPTLSVRRDRFVTEGLHEDLDVTNHGDEAQRVRVELALASDFADVMEHRSTARSGTAATASSSARGSRPCGRSAAASAAGPSSASSGRAASAATG
jgi:glycogen debranching enzyme